MVRIKFCHPKCFDFLAIIVYSIWGNSHWEKIMKIHQGSFFNVISASKRRYTRFYQACQYLTMGCEPQIYYLIWCFSSNYPS